MGPARPLRAVESGRREMAEPVRLNAGARLTCFGRSEGTIHAMRPLKKETGRSSIEGFNRESQIHPRVVRTGRSRFVAHHESHG